MLISVAECHTCVVTLDIRLDLNLEFQIATVVFSVEPVLFNKLLLSYLSSDIPSEPLLSPVPIRQTAQPLFQLTILVRTSQLLKSRFICTVSVSDWIYETNQIHQFITDSLYRVEVLHLDHSFD